MIIIIIILLILPVVAEGGDGPRVPRQLGPRRGARQQRHPRHLQRGVAQLLTFTLCLPHG